MKSKVIKIILPLVFWIGVWELASLLVSGELALFLPGPFSVIKSFFEMLPQKDFWSATGTTLLRIFGGFFAGSFIGLLFGILTAEIKILDIIVSPALKIIRAVPVVSFIILAFLFIKIDVLPVFISALMVVPLVWQNTYDGIKDCDNKLTEMATVYKIGRIKTLLSIKVIECSEQIISSLINAVGLAWKSGIAAEVICLPIISIGKNINTAKANLDFDKVYALTLTVVILSLVFEILLKYIWKKYKNREVKENV